MGEKVTKNSIYFIFLLYIQLYLTTVQTDHFPCQKRYYDQHGDSFVCVCNSTYCDTIEPIDGNDGINTNYQEFITCKNGYRLEKFKNKFDNSISNNSQIVFTVNRTNSYQTIFGFGAAVTDATGYNVFSLSQGSIDNFLNSYFGSNGLEYNVLRVPMAGVDFSVREYSYDDYPNDFNLTNFSLSIEDIKWKIPIIKAALNISKKDIKLFSSAWSAPPWMKTNNDYKGNGTLIGEPGSMYWQIWANYYLKFFQAYSQFNIKFWGVTAQNEPTDGNIYKFEFNCMGFSPESQSTFISENLGPTLAKNGFGDIKIMILDDQRLFLPGWPQRVFEHSPTASQYISGIAVHWYLDGLIPPNVLDLTHEMFPDKFIFGTEACIGEGPQQHVILGSFVRAEDYARLILQDLNHWVTGWTDWNMALDLQGGPNWSNNFVDSSIIVNATADEFYKQPIFYIMGHFSKFIPINSYRISLNKQGMHSDFINYAAFYEPTAKQTTIVLLNDGETSEAYSIYDPDLNVYINSILEPHSIKSVVWYNN